MGKNSIIVYMKNFFNDLNLNRKDSIYLLALSIFSILLTVNLIEVNYSLNFKPDSFVYLVNALVYAGMEGNIQNYAYSMFLTPVVSFLTSLLFRWEIVDKIAIMIVTGVIAIFGEIGLYLLLKNRFNSVYSLFGCILFASFEIILTFWGNGGIDLPVCNFAIFTILFIVIAVNKNPKYYILTSIFLILAIFTKYDALFLIPLLLLYYLSKHDPFNLLDLALGNREEFKKVTMDYLKSKEFKYLMVSILLGAVLFMLFCEVIWSFGSNLTFITQSQEAMNGFHSFEAYKSTFFNSDKYVYLNTFYSFFYPKISKEASYIIPLIILIGTIFNFAHVLKERTDYHIVKEYNVPYFKYIIIAMILILTYFLVNEFESSHMDTNIRFLVICVCILSLAGRINLKNKDNFDLDILFLAWIFIFTVFFSFITIKGYRYLIIAMPPVVYFVLRSIEEIFFRFKDSKMVHIALIIIMVCLAFYCLTYTFEDSVLVDEMNNTALQDVYDHLVEYDSDYISKNICSEYSYGARFGNWTLKKDVKYIKRRDLADSNMDYIISKDELHKANYTEIYKSGEIRLYQNVIWQKNNTYKKYKRWSRR